MARIMIGDIVQHLEGGMRRALERAVDEAVPGAEYDSRDLFRSFCRAVGAKCSTWEEVPDGCVETQ